MRKILLLLSFFTLSASMAHAFSMSQCTGANSALGFDAINGIVCTAPLGNSVSHVGKATNISVSPGTISLGTKTVTVTGLTGVQTNDICVVSLAASQSITAGLVLAGCRASGTGQVDIIFSTPIALGISAGTVSVDIGWLG